MINLFKMRLIILAVFILLQGCAVSDPATFLEQDQVEYHVDAAFGEVAHATIVKAFDTYNEILGFEFYVEGSRATDCTFAQTVCRDDPNKYKAVELVGLAQHDMEGPNWRIILSAKFEDQARFDRFYILTVHEIGHLFGLPHDDSSTECVMSTVMDGDETLEACDFIDKVREVAQ